MSKAQHPECGRADMVPEATYAVAASGRWTDPDGIRAPAGEAHAWIPATNQTLCGLPLHRAGLIRFPHVPWPDAFPESGRMADRISRICPRCRAAAGIRRAGRSWTRTAPRSKDGQKILSPSRRSGDRGSDVRFQGRGGGI